jgi:hypothetical protein
LPKQLTPDELAKLYGSLKQAVEDVGHWAVERLRRRQKLEEAQREYTAAFVRRLEIQDQITAGSLEV